MRAIKFRTWNGYSMGVNSRTIQEIMIWSGEVTTKCVNDLLFMQYTGIKDKNGVEIYEGDIVNICYTSNSGYFIHDCIYDAQISDLDGLCFNFKGLLWESYGCNQIPLISTLNASNGIGSIYSGDRGFLYVADDYQPTPRIENSYPFNDEDELKFHSRYFEVIGNIHENPELLESNNESR